MKAYLNNNKVEVLNLTEEDNYIVEILEEFSTIKEAEQFKNDWNNGYLGNKREA